MREALALLFLIVLIAMGWKQPYRNHVNSVVPQVGAAAQITTPDPRQQRMQAVPVVPRDRSWMWERTKMDAPYDKTHVR